MGHPHPYEGQTDDENHAKSNQRPRKELFLIHLMALRQDDPSLLQRNTKRSISSPIRLQHNQTMLARIHTSLLLAVLTFAAQSVAFSFNAPKPFVRCSVVRNSEVALTDEGDVFDTPQSQVVSSEYIQDGSTIRSEYGALAAGTVVQVQVGDISLARKAWKKRRRTGSPLLVPCSILNVDQRSMVRWNLIFLLEKFGQAQADGIRIGATDLSQRYRKFLKSSLQASTTFLVRGQCSFTKANFIVLTYRSKPLRWGMRQTRHSFRICSTKKAKNPTASG